MSNVEQPLQVTWYMYIFFPNLPSSEITGLQNQYLGCVLLLSYMGHDYTKRDF